MEPRFDLTETILSRGCWQDMGTTAVQANINLLYTLERCKFRLSINEARLQLPEQEAVPAVLFAGNFHYDLVGRTVDKCLQHLHKTLANWQDDLVAYREIIDDKFLVGLRENTVSVLPTLAVS
ncbi:MAG TPA: hypothetical protein DDZ80_29320 [Cyanobacteria bacterium UBA8803]|nr:hypothetical protein [Cyanobacteria bacterium UBA8803]